MQKRSLYCNDRNSSNMDVFSSGWPMAETQVSKSGKQLQCRDCNIKA